MNTTYNTVNAAKRTVNTRGLGQVVQCGHPGCEERVFVEEGDDTTNLFCGARPPHASARDGKQGGEGRATTWCRMGSKRTEREALAAL